MNWSETVPRAVQGDAAAWEELYNATRREAYFVALKVCGNLQDAEDLTQEAYLAALGRLLQLQEAEKFPSWLYMIVANKCRDYLKKKKPALFTELQKDDAPAPDWADDREENLPEVRLEHQETVRLVAEIIDGLPEDQKLCLLLYYRDELSVSQIAQALQVSEGTVKSRLNYGRRKVKSKVEALEKQGTKLYGLAPMALLTLLLRQEAEAMPLPAGLTAAGAAAVTATDAVASGAATAVTGKAAGGLAVKIAAGVLAAGLVAGGAVAAKNALAGNAVDVPDADVQAVVSVEEQAAEAYAAYEELLRRGVTDSGLEIKYYTTFDLEKDGIPELLTANNPGTAEWLTDAQFYAYDDDGLRVVGDAGSYYDSIYVINDTYLRCMGRPGISYVGKAEQFYKDRLDADYEYHYYFPGEIDGDTFVKTAERLELKPNKFAPKSDYTVDLVEFILHFPADWEGKVIVENNFSDHGLWEYYTVYEAESYAAGAGELFSITLFGPDSKDYLYWPDYTYLGTYESLASGIVRQFVASRPTDVQFTPETQDTYTAMIEQYDTILDNIEWIWRPYEG